MRGKLGCLEARQPQQRRVRHIDGDQIDRLWQPLRGPCGGRPLLAVQGNQGAADVLRKAGRRAEIGRVPDGRHEDRVDPLRLDMVTRPEQVPVRTMMI